MIGAKEFDGWIKKTGLQNDDQALLAFLTDPEGRGFAYIKSYEALCALAKVMRSDYGYKTSDKPCSSMEFGRLVLDADCELFNQLMPSLPEEVKFELMAEKFHLWAKGKQRSSWNDLYQQFFYEEGVLEHIQNYVSFCLLANTVRKNYGYELSNPPCSEASFCKIILTTTAIYLGEQPLEISSEMLKMVEEEKVLA